ncbi:MAG: hypothetical protein J6A69_07580 [Clostridia bacterium]|nr:hypothetical protein [Clostridia bacterium]
MNDLLQLSVLFEYYGKMLTKRQYDVCDMYLNQNLSLSEVSENLGITRQGVRDSLIKSENILINFEEKLGIMKKNENLSEIVIRIQELIDKSCIEESHKTEITKLTNQINNLI